MKKDFLNIEELEQAITELNMDEALRHRVDEIIRRHKIEQKDSSNLDVTDSLHKNNLKKIYGVLKPLDFSTNAAIKIQYELKQILHNFLNEPKEIECQK